MDNKFKIFCLSYNNEKWVSTHINSILNQTYDNYEVFYLDDCSTDNTLNEVKKFIKLKIKKDKSSNKVIGINEIQKYFRKEQDLSLTKELIRIKTRQYAKRQSTWSRGHMFGWQKIDHKNLDSFLKKI